MKKFYSEFYLKILSEKSQTAKKKIEDPFFAAMRCGCDAQ